MTPYQRQAIHLRRLAQILRTAGFAALAEVRERDARALEAADRAERRKSAA